MEEQDWRWLSITPHSRWRGLRPSMRKQCLCAGELGAPGLKHIEQWFHAPLYRAIVLLLTESECDGLSEDIPLELQPFIDRAAGAWARRRIAFSGDLTEKDEYQVRDAHGYYTMFRDVSANASLAIWAMATAVIISRMSDADPKDAAVVKERLFDQMRRSKADVSKTELGDLLMALEDMDRTQKLKTYASKPLHIDGVWVLRNTTKRQVVYPNARLFGGSGVFGHFDYNMCDANFCAMLVALFTDLSTLGEGCGDLRLFEEPGDLSSYLRHMIKPVLGKWIGDEIVFDRRGNDGFQDISKSVSMCVCAMKACEMARESSVGAQDPRDIDTGDLRRRLLSFFLDGGDRNGTVAGVIVLHRLLGRCDQGPSLSLLTMNVMCFASDMFGFFLKLRPLRTAIEIWSLSKLEEPATREGDFSGSKKRRMR